MSFDLAISRAGDLIVTPNRDLSGISGTDLIEQRMKIRLRVEQGTWTYDETNSLGSQLHRLLGISPARAAAIAPAYVHEALRAMDDIEVTAVNVFPAVGFLTIFIDYRVLDDLDAPNEENAQRLEIMLTAEGTT